MMKWFRKHPLLALAVVLGCSLASRSAARADLLFCGLTDTGWQIFRCDDEGDGTVQLTNTIGDKRCPRVDPANGYAYYRDSNGEIRSLSLTPSPILEENPVIPLSEISDFYVLSNVFYFNRLATGNSQRRFVWKWESGGGEPDGVTTLLLRRDVGSLRQVRVSPSGKFGVATFLWRQGEERLGTFLLSDDGVDSESWKLLTEEFTVSAFPCWEDDDSVIFSGEVSEGNFDLFRVSRSTGIREPVVETEAASEFSPTVGAGLLFFERNIHDTPGSALICRKSLNSTAVKTLDIGIPAKEPHWFDSALVGRNPTE